MQSARPRTPRTSSCKVSSVGVDGCGAGSGSVSRPVCNMRESVFHMVSSPVVSAIGKVERFIDQREVGHDIAQDGVVDQRPVLPRRVVCVAAPNGTSGAGFESNHDRATPTFDESDAEKICGWSGHRGLNFSAGKSSEKYAAESQGFHDFVETHLHPGGN